MTKRLGAYLLAIAFALATMTGCSSSQAVNVINGISTQLPVALELAGNIAAAAGDPAFAAALKTAAVAVQADVPALQAAIAAWQSNQSSTNLQKIAAVVTALASTINTQVLAANKLANTQNEQLALASLTSLAAIVNGFAIALGSVNKQTMTAVRNMPVPYSAVAALIPRQQKQQAAARWGVSIDASGL